MKAINSIKDLRTEYHRRYLGEQVIIDKMPFLVLGGKLTEHGDIENSAPSSHEEIVEGKALTAATNSQFVMQYNNQYYKKLLLGIIQRAVVASYDWKLEYNHHHARFGERQIAGSTGTTRWYVNAIGDNVMHWYDGEVSYGENVLIDLECDNNHASTVITIDAIMIFHDPVR